MNLCSRGGLGCSANIGVKIQRRIRICVKLIPQE